MEILTSEEEPDEDEAKEIKKEQLKEGIKKIWTNYNSKSESDSDDDSENNTDGSLELDNDITEEKGPKTLMTQWSK